MSLKVDLETEVKKIFKEDWTSRTGQIVPQPEDLKLSNDAVVFEKATVVYADLSESTVLVDSMKWEFSAEIYKTYLYCAAKIIRSEGGIITSYDGDRVMGIFIGDTQCSAAVRCALKINYAVQNIINPAIKSQYTASSYQIKQIVGIDTSKIHAARTGVRGGNDIVWVGRAANYAAKLTSVNNTHQTWITKAVYDSLENSTKFYGKDNTPAWSSFTWNTNNNQQIYGSTCWWAL